MNCAKKRNKNEQLMSTFQCGRKLQPESK